MTRIVKAPTAADFLALVPHLLGFEPHDSVVIVAFRGNRTCCAIRFDPPTGESDVVLRRIATSMIGMLSKVDGVDAVVPIVYTDHPLGPIPPLTAFMGVLIERFGFSGFLVRDALFVAGDAWGPYDEEQVGPDSVGSTPGRYALDEISRSDIRAQVRDEIDPLQTQEERAELPAVDLATKQRVARLLRDGVGPCADELLDDPPDLPGLLEDAIDLEAADLPDTVAAGLIAVVQSGEARDVAMLQWAFALEVGDQVLDRAQVLATVDLMMGLGPRPDRERLARATTLVLALAARAPRAYRPPLLTMGAWYQWAAGRSSVANILVGRAQDIDPGYGLAEIVSAMLQHGRMPEWIFEDPNGEPTNRSAQWRVDELGELSDLDGLDRLDESNRLEESDELDELDRLDELDQHDHQDEPWER